MNKFSVLRVCARINTSNLNVCMRFQWSSNNNNNNNYTSLVSSHNQAKYNIELNSNEAIFSALFYECIFSFHFLVCKQNTNSLNNLIRNNIPLINVRVNFFFFDWQPNSFSHLNKNMLAKNIWLESIVAPSRTLNNKLKAIKNKSICGCGPSTAPSNQLLI